MSPNNENVMQIGGNSPELDKVGGRSHSYKQWLVVSIALVAAVALVASGIWSRVRANAKLRTETSQVALTAVSVVSPQRTTPVQEIILPGNVQPFITSPIYSRTNGYLKQWYVDIGAHVKQGQLLAVIETPEVDQQLEQSLSNLNTAKANLALAEITMNRYEGLLKSKAVAQQDVDNAVGTYNANKAIVDANQANVKQVQALQSFEKIYSPFDGVVTARNTDIGDLINSGSNGGVKTDLFHIAQPGVLRVYVNVPEEYSQGVNVSTRTLLIEIDVGNPAGTLLTGSYAEVHLKVQSQASTFLLPVNTLLFRSEGLQVGIVKDGNVALTTVTPGHDFGDQIEIVAGLKSNDQVIINPPDSIISGQKIQIVQGTLPGDAK
jgi:multidrug efflux pump subunit AcrA (membrane-fusion protein)